MQRSEVGASGALESYLARLDEALARVPAADRREILLETRSHVAEQTRRSPWRGVEDVLAELGPAEAYARQFLPEDEPARSAPPRVDTPRREAPYGRALLGLARLVSGGLTTLPLLFLVVTAYAIAFIAFWVAVAKLNDPAHIGLWISETAAGRATYTFGVYDTPPAGREVLGHGLTALMFGIALGTHLAVSALLKRLVRKT